MAAPAIQPVAALTQPTRPLPPVGRPADARWLATLRAAGRKLDARDPRLIREAAAKVVSQLFFAPLLAELRKLPFGRKFASGGRTEEIFGEQLDLRIADSVAAAQYSGLTRQLAEHLQANVPAEPDPDDQEQNHTVPQWPSP